MTKAQAASLQLKWKLRVPVLSCLHLHKELWQQEEEDDGMTNLYHCLSCGEEFEGSSA